MKMFETAARDFAMAWRSTLAALAAAGAALVLAGCETVPELPDTSPRFPSGQIPAPQPTPAPGTPGAPGAEPGEDFTRLPERNPLTPAHLQGRSLTRAALLLPFSSSNRAVREQAEALREAAELAMFKQAHTDFLLMPIDTQGTPEGARAAARDAYAKGADIILGPMLSSSVEPAGAVARQADLPMIAFTTDISLAGDGVYLLSFTPEQDVARVTDYLSRQGSYRLAVFAPENNYGRRAASVLEREAALHGGYLSASSFYGASSDDMVRAARDLAASAGGFDAVLIPEGGRDLRTAAPLLPYYGVDLRSVTFFGTSVWNDANVSRESALFGGVFPAPDPNARARFEADYRALYGKDATRLSSLAYDVTAIASYLARVSPRDPFSARNLEDPEGFQGADGLFRFRSDGQAERGLAVMEITPQGFVVRDPAPTSFLPRLN